MRSLENSYAALPPQMFEAEGPTPVSDPKGFALNDALAASSDLALDDRWADILSGSKLPEGMTPITQAYSGHQFGHWNAQLGDGRAVLLGEASFDGVLHDVQLKGSGRTKWSRGGDGRAWLGPVLREYVISEAMHALGIPTTRALAAVTTGDPVLREQGPLPGAVITRVARSHIRVGTFQYFAARQDFDALTALRDYTIARHYPDATNAAELLEHAVTAQAELVAKWMSVGFIHGVMNTDNAHVGGLTIDYGPCAFMDTFDPMKVFSSIDHTGRYAFGNQPQMAAWNMAQLATALLPLEADRDAAVESFTKIVHGFGDRFEPAYQSAFAGKLGLDPDAPDTGSVIDDLMAIMAGHDLDFTNTFWALSQGELPDGWPTTAREWALRWKDLRDPSFQKLVPALIPRNHQIEAMITEAVKGDRSRFDRLHTALATPFDLPKDHDLTLPPEPAEVVQRTFCGT